jgi:hypothetical protein
MTQVRYRLESSHPRWVSIPALTGCGSMSNTTRTTNRPSTGQSLNPSSYWVWFDDVLYGIREAKGCSA